MNYQEFPRCLYLPDGTGRIVNTEEEKKTFLEKGWSESPPPKPACQPEAAPDATEQPGTAPKGQDGDIAASAEKVMSQPKPRGNPKWLKKRW